jgi:hypothetical protein
MLATLENGDAAEVGIVSNEGLAGLALLLDDEQDDLEGVVQIPDLAFRISTEEFRRRWIRYQPCGTCCMRWSITDSGTHRSLLREAPCRRPPRAGC